MKSYNYTAWVRGILLMGNIRIICAITLFACLSLSGVLHAAEHGGLKNLYVLIDPANVEKDDKISLRTEAVYIKHLIDSLSKRSLKFKNVVFRMAGSKNREPKVYTRKKLLEIKSKTFAKAKLKQGRALGSRRHGKGVSHAMTKALGDYSNILDKLGWKGSDTLLLILSDINFVGDVGSSYGGALNSAWLNNPKSPFVRFFIKKDNSFAKGTSVIIFTRTQLDMNLEKMRSAFLMNLFEKAGVGIKTYYVGSMRSSSYSKNLFTFDVVKRVQQKELHPLSVAVLPEVRITQVLRGDAGESTIRNFK